MKFFFLFFVCFSPLFSQGTAYFIPPKGWKEIDPNSLTPFVQMGYVGKGASSFAPSINIAEESVGTISQKEYLDIVKKLHTANPSTSWRRLGPLQTKIGKAELTEITIQNSGSKIKMLQCIFLRDGQAHIITGASDGTEFGKFRKIFTSVFLSFNVTTDLVRELKDPTREQKIGQYFTHLTSLLQKATVSEKEKKANVLDFHAYLTNECPEQGSYWHYLVLKELERKVRPPQSAISSLK